MPLRIGCPRPRDNVLGLGHHHVLHSVLLIANGRSCAWEFDVKLIRNKERGCEGV